MAQAQGGEEGGMNRAEFKVKADAAMEVARKELKP